MRTTHAVGQVWLPRVKDPSIPKIVFFKIKNVFDHSFSSGVAPSPPATFGRGFHPLGESLVLLKDLSEPR